MDTKTNKLLQQAGKYILLGKLSLALEYYLRIHQLEPEDTTIMNTIGDLYVKLENREEALAWYQKLAETFECRELYSNATATYRKILKLSPKSRDAMTRLAQLHERQGQIANAKLQYKMIANLLMSLGEYDGAIATYQKICDLHPSCHESQLELGHVLEKFEKSEEANHAYLKCAELLTQHGDRASAASVVENIFRIKPRNKNFAKSFFKLLREIGLTERGVEYLQSISLDGDPDIKAMLGEVFLQDRNLEVAQKYLLDDVRKNRQMYPATIKLLGELIKNKDLNASLDVVDAIFESSIQLHDEVALKIMLDSIHELDESNMRTLKTLTTLLIRINDREQLESHLKRLAILQLKSANIREARDTFNKMVVYGQNSFYLDLLNELNDAMIDGSAQNLRDTCQKVIHALERGSFEKAETLSGMGLALGVSDLDLGLALRMPMEEELLKEPAGEADAVGAD
jgi:tetratricopeptide (TPR) repeat protein